MSGSEEKIVRAFEKLLDVRPYNKITVKSVVETAHLHRNTFYYHFSDIPALLDYMGDRWIDMVMEKFDPRNECFALEHSFVGFAETHRSEILNLYHSEAREKLEAVIRKLGHRLSETYLQSVSAKLQFSAREMSALEYFFSSTVSGVLTCWIADGMTRDLGYDFKCYLHFADIIHSRPDSKSPVDTTLLRSDDI